MKPILVSAVLMLPLLIPFLGLAWASSAGGDEDEMHIKQAIHASIAWADNKDKDLLFRCLAQDAELFIFHPDSRSTVIGFEPFRKMVESTFMSDAFKAAGYAIRELRIHRNGSGDTAWYSAILDDRGEFNGRPYAWENTRWTGVLEKRDGRWVIVQMHFSFASDQVEAEVKKALEAAG